MAAFCGSKSINSVSRSSDLSRMARPRLLTFAMASCGRHPKYSNPIVQDSHLIPYYPNPMEGHLRKFLVNLIINAA